MSAMQTNRPAAIREEELKNRVAALFFGKYDCTRIVGDIDFCVSPKRRDPRQMTFISDVPILWAEAKNHPTDIYRARTRTPPTTISVRTFRDASPTAP